MNTKTILSILALIIVIFLVVWIARSDKAVKDASDQQVIDQALEEDEAISSENLPNDSDPVTMPPSSENETQEDTPAFPKTGFPETE